MKRLFLCIMLAGGLGTAGATANYINYHREIIGAEKQFLSAHFDSSILSYRQIFTEYEYPFAKDCFIAVEIASLQNDTAAATFFLDKCFRSGVNISAMNGIGRINSFIDAHAGYRERVENLYTQKRKEYLHKINWPLRAQVTALAFRDDVYKTIPLDGMTLIEGNILYARILDANLTEMVDIIHRFGYPGDKLIGLIDPQLSDQKEEGHQYRMHAITTLLFFHHACGFQVLKTALWKAVLYGELHPRDYALMYEWSYQYFKEAAHHTYPSKNLFPFHYCTAPRDTQSHFYNLFIDRLLDNPNAAIVNKDRAEIGISTLEHDAAKRAFGKKYKLMMFFGFSATI